MSPLPLAYAFWHWKQPGVSQERYEAAQVAFQAALAADPPPGYLGGSTSRVAGAPWLDQGGPGYEDWYLVADLAALEPLNAGAVSGSRAGPHEAVARLAEGGTAGLYGMRAGRLAALPRAAVWFAKPPGMGYAALDALLEPLTSRGTELWSRRMTLGPTPEFCLRGPAGFALPPPLTAAHALALDPLFPPG